MNFSVLIASVLGIGAMVSCSKSNNSSSSSSPAKDSVLYSNWIPLNLKLQDLNTNPDSDYRQTIAASALTAAILNKGTVSVYCNETGSGGTYVNSAADLGIYPTLTPGNLLLDAYYTNGYQLSTNQYFDSVRYVIIPGSISTTNASGGLQTYTPAQLKQMNYATVSKLFGIPASGSSLK